MRAYIIRNKEEQPDGIEIVADTDEDRELLKRAWLEGVKVASYHREMKRRRKMSKALGMWLMIDGVFSNQRGKHWRWDNE